MIHLALLKQNVATVDQVSLEAKKLFRPERCSLSDKNFETLMMIKCNSEIRTLIMKK